MRKFTCLLLVLMLFITPMALAEGEKKVERNYDPAPGEGWLYCTIYDELIEFKYVTSVKSMADTTHSFESEKYTLNLVFNKDLKVGEEMEENGLKSIEVVSSETKTAGYYAVKKSTSKNVESKVLLEKEEEGLKQGTFHAMIHPADRWVGDLRPGIIEDLPLEEGEFCFNQEL